MNTAILQALLSIERNCKMCKEISQDVLSMKFITTGGSEALNTIINCIYDPGDEIIIPDPYYANYNGLSTLAVPQ